MLALLLVAWCALSAAAPPSPEPVRLCLLLRRVAGSEIENSVLLAAMAAIQHANSRDGAVSTALAALDPAQRVEFQLHDEMSTPSHGIAAFLRCADERHPADIIVGPGRSAVAIPVARVAQHWDLMQISHWSTSSTLSDKRVFPFFSRAITSDKDVARAAAFLLHSPAALGFKTVHFLYATGDAFGASYLADYSLEFERSFAGGGGGAGAAGFPRCCTLVVPMAAADACAGAGGTARRCAGAGSSLSVSMCFNPKAASALDPEVRRPALTSEFHGLHGGGPNRRGSAIRTWSRCDTAVCTRALFPCCESSTMS